MREGAEILPGDKIHREKAASLLFAHLVDSHDIGMMERGGGGGLAAKAGQLLWTCKDGIEKHLNRYLAIQTYLAPTVDNAHAASGNPFQEFIISDAGVDPFGTLFLSG